jgi:predicted transcriptional regulator
MLFVEQVKAARMLLGWDQATLAKRAGLGIATIKRLEAQPGLIGGTMSSANRIKEAVEKAGVIFISPDKDGGPGVRLLKPRSR